MKKTKVKNISFDEILKINYKYNFYPEVKRINVIKKI